MSVIVFTGNIAPKYRRWLLFVSVFVFTGVLLLRLKFRATIILPSNYGPVFDV